MSHSELESNQEPDITVERTLRRACECDDVSSHREYAIDIPEEAVPYLANKFDIPVGFFDD